MPSVRRYLAEVRRIRVPLIAAALMLLFRNAYIRSARSEQEPLYTSNPDAPIHPGRSGPVETTQSSGASGPRVVLYWTTFYDSEDFEMGLGSTPFDGCPIMNCLATNNRSQLPVADAVLFHGRDLDESDLPKFRRPEQKFIFFQLESPMSTNLSLTKFDGFFNLTVTYSRDADIFHPYGETVTGVQEGQIPDFHQRKPSVAWMVSTCQTPSERELHAKQLGNRISLEKVGLCGPQRCNESKAECFRRLADDNLFYLAYENSLCDDYITDMFWLSLQAGMVPVVRGPAPEAYRRVAPPGSFIHAMEFGGPFGLSNYLLSLTRNQTAYSAYHAWRSTHRVQGRQSACDLCAELWKQSGDGSRRVLLSDVWSPKKHCRKSNDIGVEFFMDRVLKVKTKSLRSL